MSVGSWFHEMYEKVTGAPMQQHVDMINKNLGVPAGISTDTGFAKTVGSTLGGRTLGGGRKKTRKLRRKHAKR